MAATDAVDGKWRPPSNLREGIATIVALVLTLATVQVLAPVAKQATFLTEEIRNYLAGLGFAVFPPAYRFVNQGVQGLGARGGLLRPDLSPWFVTGLTAAALLFVWNTFVGLFTGIGMGVAMAQLGGGFDQKTVAGAITTGGAFTAIPLTAVAAVFAGMLLNRWTRSGVVAALLLASLAYLLLNIFLTSVIQPEMLRQQMELAKDPQQAAALFAGVLLVALITFLFGGLGVIVSRIRKERSIGRLVTAARKLPPKDRDALTEDVLAMLERRR